jgi:hypothetical protein
MCEQVNVVQCKVHLRAVVETVMNRRGTIWISGVHICDPPGCLIRPVAAFVNFVRICCRNYTVM